MATPLVACWGDRMVDKSADSLAARMECKMAECWVVERVALRVASKDLMTVACLVDAMDVMKAVWLVDATAVHSVVWMDASRVVQWAGQRAAYSAGQWVAWKEP